MAKNGNEDCPGDDAQVQIQSTSTVDETTISFTDNGIGMELSQLQRIFKAGVRGVSASSFTGSEFGLAICERIVKARGGRIRAESSVGDGQLARQDQQH